MTPIPALLQLQQDDLGAAAAGGILAAIGGVMLLVWLAIMVVMIAAGWKVFVKAGQPGWAVLIPIYNAYILLKIAGKPGWWLLLFCIPLVNIVIGIIVAIEISKAFGQSPVFAIALLLGIGYLMLGFGKYRYVGPAAAVA